MPIPDMLNALLRVPGPSGQEARAAAAWRELCAPFAAEVDVDVNGSSWARAGNRSSRPVAKRGPLAVVGHIDEIGVHITHIDDEGFLRFGQVGGWDPVQLVGQRLVLATRSGEVRGVIGRKAIHQLDEDERKRAPELKNLHIDIGATSGDDARERVRIGDTGVIDVQPLELPNNLVVSRSLDNRVGCYVAARAAQLVAESGGAPGDVLALAVVQEEIGLNGARTSAFRHDPDVAIAIDVTHANDTPGVELGPGHTPQAGLRARDPARRDHPPASVRAALRGRRGRVDPIHAQLQRPLHRHRRRRVPRGPCGHRDRAGISAAAIHALGGRDDQHRRPGERGEAGGGIRPPARAGGVVRPLTRTRRTRPGRGHRLGARMP